MSKTSPLAIRLSITPEVAQALYRAKRKYPTLSDPEILKLGLAKIITDNYRSVYIDDETEIRGLAAQAVGEDYLDDPSEDTYRLGVGKKTSFS